MLEVLQMGSRSWSEPRTVRVFLPDQLNPREARVLVMLDGQNAFDQSTAFIESWNAHQVLQARASKGDAFAIVAINNAGEAHARLHEYNLKKGAPALGEAIFSDVLPRIGREYGLKMHGQNIAVMGAGLAGVCALYLGLRYSVALTACISPSLWVWGADVNAFVQSSEGNNRIYLDTGTHEAGAHALNQENLKKVRSLREDLIRAGHQVAYQEVTGGTHSEKHWRQRLPTVLDAFMNFEDVSRAMH